ncbi:MAG: metal-dependent hydrolase [Actinomycetota bacterium]
MILWHLGTAAALTYVSLGRRRIDYRYVLAGAVAPDLIDPLLGRFVPEGPAGRGMAHSLLAVVLVTLVVLGAFRGERRLATFGLAVGWLLHLVADGMWQAPETFLWPAFGSGFATAPREPYSWDLVLHPVEHALTWAGEVAGALVLGWFWVAFRLGEQGRLRQFLADGYLRP